MTQHNPVYNPTSPDYDGEVETRMEWEFDQFKRLFKRNNRFFRFYNGEVVCHSPSAEHDCAKGKYYPSVHMSVLSSRSSHKPNFEYEDGQPIPAAHLTTQTFVIQWSTRHVVALDRTLGMLKDDYPGIPGSMRGYWAYVPEMSSPIIGSPVLLRRPFATAPEELREQYTTLRDMCVAEAAISQRKIENRSWAEMRAPAPTNDWTITLGRRHMDLLPENFKNMRDGIKDRIILQRNPRYEADVPRILVSKEQSAAAFKHLVPKRESWRYSEVCAS